MTMIISELLLICLLTALLPIGLGNTAPAVSRLVPARIPASRARRLDR